MPSPPGQVCNGPVSKRCDGGQYKGTVSVTEHVSVEASTVQTWAALADRHTTRWVAERPKVVTSAAGTYYPSKILIKKKIKIQIQYKWGAIFEVVVEFPLHWWVQRRCSEGQRRAADRSSQLAHSPLILVLHFCLFIIILAIDVLL